MIDISKYSEKIQKYLSDELSVDEVTEFEELIKKHSELQEEIQLHKKVSRAIADPSLENFKKDLEDIHDKNFGNQISLNQTKSRRWILFAALILILITIGSVFLFKKNAINSQHAFDKYYSPLAVDHSRSLTNERDAYVLAMNAFERADYNLAFEQFKDIVAVDKDNYSARLYLGICGIELNKLSIAETQFQQIIESADPFFIQDAEWYLALLYLKMEEVEKAKRILESIHKRAGVFSQKAFLVLDDIQ